MNGGIGGGVACALAAVLIWGAYMAMAKAGVVAGLAAPDIALLRYGVAGLVLLPWLAFGGVGRFVALGPLRIAALTLLAGPPFVLIGVGGFAWAPLAHGAVIQPAMLTISGLVLAAWLLDDRPGAERIVGVGVMVAGLVLVAGSGIASGGWAALTGDLMFATAGAMWASFSVLARRWRVTPFAGTAIVAITSALVFVPLHLHVSGLDRLRALPLDALAQQAIVQGLLSGIVAVMAFAEAVRRLGAARAAAFPALVPAVATALGLPLVGEIPTQLQLAGLVMVTFGLVVAAGGLALPRLRDVAGYRMNLLRSAFFARSPTLPRT